MSRIWIVFGPSRKTNCTHRRIWYYAWITDAWNNRWDSVIVRQNWCHSNFLLMGASIRHQHVGSVKEARCWRQRGPCTEPEIRLEIARLLMWSVKDRTVRTLCPQYSSEMIFFRQITALHSDGRWVMGEIWCCIASSSRNSCISVILDWRIVPSCFSNI